MKKGLVIEIISAVLILLFAYTALSKLIGHETFSTVLSTAPLLKSYAATLSWVLPVAEVIVVLLLFLPSVRIAGLFASLALLLLFTGYLVYMIMYAPELPCNCGGVIAGLSWKEHIVFNVFFITLSASGIALYPKYKIHPQKIPP